MTFIEAFEKIKEKTADSAKLSGQVEGHLALQVNLSDDDANGIMYIEVKDGALSVEPYDYFDHDAVLYVKSADLIKIMTGRLGYDRALENGALKIEGNAEKAELLKKLVVKKTAVKKPDEKAPAKKADEKPAKKKCCKKK